MFRLKLDFHLLLSSLHLVALSVTILCEVGTCEQAVSLLSDKLLVVILHADLELRYLFYCKCLVGDSIHLFG